VLDSWEFSGESGHVRIHVCVTAVWGAGPVRTYLVILLVWVPGRYAFFLGNPLIRLAGLYWLFRLLSIVLAWMCVIKQVGGVAGGRDSTIFLASPAFWWVRYD
jgi:ABC-type branched-subunit amino acid transport system permease subunit